MAINNRSRNIVRQVPMRTFTVDDETLRRMQNAQGDGGQQQGFTEAQKMLSTDMSQRVLTVPADSEDVDIAITQLTNTLYNNLYALDDRLTNVESVTKQDISATLQTQINNLNTQVAGLQQSINSFVAQLTDINGAIAETSNNVLLLTNEVALINMQVQALQNANITINSRLSAAENDIDALDTRVTDLENT